MRRMYSEQELTKIIKEVSEAYIDELIEDGEFDQAIADYVDAYLVEHPVDITALEGQTIAPANVNATGNITANSIIENMSGYLFINGAESPSYTQENVYAGIVKNGNKLTLVFAFNLTKTGTSTERYPGVFRVPQDVYDKLNPAVLGSSSVLSNIVVNGIDTIGSSGVSLVSLIYKTSNREIGLNVQTANMVLNTKYYIRIEATFLLSDNLIS